jgi:DNA/RNA endonuclease YhcR with UshA esterase domain
VKKVLLYTIAACTVFLMLTTFCLAEGKKINAREASSYIGQEITVCGVVASSKYAFRSKGQPTFLNLDEPYPHQIFTVLIWGNDRLAFGTPDVYYSGKNICVEGVIKRYRGTPEIIVKSPDQIKLNN